MTLPKKARLTPDQENDRVVALAGYMKYAPFFAYYFYDQLEEYPTLDIDTAATDGRRIFINPEYMATLKPLERVFVLCHETYHSIYKHPTRMKYYHENGLMGQPFDPQLYNRCADYIINADLITNQIGTCNSEWLYDPNVKGDELVEDLYRMRYKGQPGGSGTIVQEPPSGSQPSNQPSQTSSPSPAERPQGTTFGEAGRRTYSKPDARAAARGGGFDDVLEPQIDPSTGKDDLPSEMEFKEAISRAADAAERSQGSIPGSMKRLIKETLEPQISWREHVRMLVTGKIGSRGETWARPNRRRLALSSVGRGLPVYMPGRNKYGADLVTVVIDNSGSINDRMLSTFFAELSGVISDCRPKRVMVIFCDYVIQKVVEASSLDELAGVRAKGSPGGGGTSFIPPFEHLENIGLKPDTLVYLTDGYGVFPKETPPFPVVWALTTDVKAPWGDVVKVKI
jgi:predicted metal-dependent peptidase